MIKEHSKDNNFYFEIHEKNNLYRINYFLNINKEILNPNFTVVYGTNTSVFDDINLALKETRRMI